MKKNSDSCQLILTPPTISYGLHGDASSVLAVALLIELNHRLPAVLLRRMQRVQAPLVSAQLLHRAGAKRVAGRDQHRETVLNEPVGDLKR